jgi:hypothetical protein
MMLMGIGVCVPLQSNVNSALALHNASKKPSSVEANASANWAGYAATGKGFTGVQASWKIPTVKPSKTFGVDATWVGIGGVTTNDLIQGGTETVVQNGIVQYIAWTEALPAASEPLNLVVHPGDTISASISQDAASGTWQVSIGDNTTRTGVTKSYNYNSSGSSVEWIEEAPSDNSGILPLDNFQSVSFSNAIAIRGGKDLNISQSGGTPITLANDTGTILARPSALGSDEQSFNVTRTAAKTVTALHRIFGSIQTWTHKSHGIKKRAVHD